MGYMGFGSQKWIRNLKPKRPFSRDRKSSGDTIPRYKREFLLRPKDAQKNTRLNAIRNLAVLLALCFIIGYGIFSFKNYHEEVSQKQVQTSKQRGEKAFRFLYNSGKERLSTGQWEQAKSEFELALKIKPENVDANKQYILTLMILCENGNIDCVLVSDQIEKAFKFLPKNAELHKLKSEYFFQIGDTLSAMNELESIQKE